MKPKITRNRCSRTARRSISGDSSSSSSRDAAVSRTMRTCRSRTTCREISGCSPFSNPHVADTLNILAAPSRQFRSYILVCSYIEIIAEPARDNEEARKTIASRPWDISRILIDCDGYSCVLVVNSGSIDSQRPLPPTRIVGCGSSGQQCRQNGRHTGTVKSTSIFNSANGDGGGSDITVVHSGPHGQWRGANDVARRGT